MTKHNTVLSNSLVFVVGGKKLELQRRSVITFLTPLQMDISNESVATLSAKNNF